MYFICLIFIFKDASYFDLSAREELPYIYICDKDLFGLCQLWCPMEWAMVLVRWQRHIEFSAPQWNILKPY